jgi:GGDEF domain-containing protein
MISSKTVGELLWLWFGANPRVARQISEALGASDELALKFFAWLGQSPTQQPQSLLSAARFFAASHRQEISAASVGTFSQAQTLQAVTELVQAWREFQSLGGTLTPQSTGANNINAAQRSVSGFNPLDLVRFWANQATAGITTLDQARSIFTRELSAYYRSEFNPAFGNRRAFEDDLLAGTPGTRSVVFVEIPGTMKPINDQIGHVAADAIPRTVTQIAQELATDPQFEGVALYHLGAARFAFEGDPATVARFSQALVDRLHQLEFSYVANGTRYEQTGLPTVQLTVPRVETASSRRDLLFSAVDGLDAEAAKLIGTQLPSTRGAPLLTLRQSQTTEGNGVRLTDPNAPAYGTRLMRRAAEALAAPLRNAIAQRADALQDLSSAIQAIQTTVESGFATDEAMGGHLPNQLAYERFIHSYADPQRLWHGFVDVGAVGVTNLRVSRLAGDMVLAGVHATANAVAEQINRELGLSGDRMLRIFAVGGDEIRFVAPDESTVRMFEQRFVEAMGATRIEGATVRAVTQRSSNVGLGGVPVYVGVGRSEDLAETASNEAKRTDQSRIPGALPPGYAVAPSDGSVVSVSNLLADTHSLTATAIAQRPQLLADLQSLERDGWRIELDPNVNQVRLSYAQPGAKRIVLPDVQRNPSALPVAEQMKTIQIVMGIEEAMATARAIEPIYARVTANRQSIDPATQVIAMQPGAANDDTQRNVVYLNAEERASYQLFVGGDGLLRTADGRLFDTSRSATHVSGTGFANFVVDNQGRIYAATETQTSRGPLQHSSFVAGGSVFYAGELVVREGRVVAVTDKSGHYAPALRQTETALQWLRQGGVELDRVRYLLKAGDVLPPQSGQWGM